MANDQRPEKNEKDELPFWSVKRQTGYKVHRVLMVIQIIVALILAFIIWFGSRMLVQ